MKRLYILTLCSLLVAVAVFLFKKRNNPTTIPFGKGLVIKKEWLAINNNPITPAEYLRPADQTFLTFPEWYLVFSPDEQAQYFRNYTATSFPFMRHTAQIWESYSIVNDQINGNFPYNGGYHFMIWVIGSSASMEYAVKSWYETVIGRLTDTHEVLTDEDKFNAAFTQEYVDFINETPWYAFDFKKQLISLWSGSIFGKHLSRKIERRYILTSELLVKLIYGKLIGLGTESVYGVAALTTAVLVDSIRNHSPALTVEKIFPNKAALLTLPRYDRFNAAISKLAQNGFTFKEIAGNNSAILLTVLLPPNEIRNIEYTQTIFTQPIASNPNLQRMAIAVPVPDLHKVLNQLHNDNVTIEHVFDF